MKTPDMRRAAKAELYRRDFVTFAREQLRIKPIESGGVIPLDLNDGQMMMDRKVEEQLRTQGYVRLVLLKGRQLGGSTYWQARMFHRAANFANFNALLIACDPEATAHIFEMSRLMYDELEPAFQPMRRYNTKRALVFENPDDKTRGVNPGLRSRIEFQSASASFAGTGTTRQGLHVSEVAKFHPDAVKFLKSSLMPTIHRVPGTFLVEESTAYVGGTHFREMIEQAQSGKTDYVFVFVPWWLDRKNAVPLVKGEKLRLTAAEKDMQRLATKGQSKIDVPPHEITPEQFKWWRCRVADIGEQMAFQEYPGDPDSAWINLDVNVFDRAILRDILKDVREPVRFATILPGRKELLTMKQGGMVSDDENYLAVWQEPQPGVVYDIGADCAVGTDEGDWSVAQVLRRDTREQVAEYHKHIDVIDYGTELYWLGRIYNNAQIGIEVNGPGYGTASQLTKLCYPYIYRWRHRDRDVLTLSTYAHWKSQQDSKQLIISNARHLFIHRKTPIRSRVLWDQLGDFSHFGNAQYGGSMGFDDAVMAWMIGIQIGLDEDVGAPKTLPSEPAAALPLSPAYRDDTEYRNRHPDAGAAAMIRDLRGSA